MLAVVGVILSGLTAPASGTHEARYFGWHPADKVLGKPKTQVLCWNKDYPAPVGTHTPQVRVTPRQCGFFKRGESSGSGAVRAKSLNWDWGNRKAVGRGVSLVNTGGSAPVVVRLSKPERNCSDDRVFTKASFRYPGIGSGGDFKLYTCA